MIRKPYTIFWYILAIAAVTVFTILKLNLYITNAVSQSSRYFETVTGSLGAIALVWLTIKLAFKNIDKQKSYK